ncbi:hypothetical protein ACJVDH_09030 [Pedobacter sp. AW1-32]|uniref:hypothetical protein n=1 Tax=Pedobacter sp. AW1-32 TaxID=3383026 RepID=UPI003FEE7E56
MSVYFQYPSIEDYPVFPATYVKTVANEEHTFIELNPEQLQELHDYLNLKLV